MILSKSALCYIVSLLLIYIIYYLLYFAIFYYYISKSGKRYADVTWNEPNVCLNDLNALLPCIIHHLQLSIYALTKVFYYIIYSFI